MNKLFKKIAMLAFSAVMAIGVGVGLVRNTEATAVHAAEQTATFVTADFPSGVAGDTSYELTKNNIKLSVTKSAVKADSYMQVYKNQSLTISSSYEIVGFQITCTASDAAKYGPGSFGTIDGYSYSGTVGSWTGRETSITLKASNNQVRYTKLVVTYDDGAGSDDVSVTDVLIENGDMTISDGYRAQILDLKANVSYEGTQGNNSVVWSSSDEKVARFFDGKILLEGNGKTTITATSKEDDTKSDSIELNVSNIAGTEENPYTVAQTLAAIKNIGDTTLDNTYTTGIVVSTSDFNSSYKNITYKLTDDGSESSPSLTVYRGKGLNNADILSEDDILVGTKLTVFGSIVNYNGTYEYTQGNYVYKFFERTLNNVVVSGTPTKLDYFVDQTFDATGLTVYASYEGTGTDSSVNLVSSVVWENNGILSLGQTSITGFLPLDTNEEFPIVVEGLNVTTATYQNTFNLSGDYYIVGYISNAPKYLASNGTSKAPGAVGTAEDATVFTLKIVDNDTFMFVEKGTDNILYSTNTNNGVRVGSTSDSWTITNATNEALKGQFSLKDTTHSRYLTIYETTPDFRGYTSEYGSNRKCNFDLIPVIDSAKYAEIFLDATNVCDPQGVTNNLTTTLWAELASKYETVTDKETFKTTTANQTGTIVEQAAARYDYIVGKYLGSGFNDFALRNPAQVGGTRFFLTENTVDYTALIIVATVAILGVSGLIIIKRRRTISE